MHILIIYGTNSSSTEEVSDIVRGVFAAAGHTVAVQRASETRPEELQSVDAAVFASATWGRVAPDKEYLDGQLQEEWFSLRERLAGKKYPGLRCAVIGVGDSRYTKFAAAAVHLEELVHEIGATHIGPTLRVDGYFFHLPERRAALRSWAERITSGLKTP